MDTIYDNRIRRIGEDKRCWLLDRTRVAFFLWTSGLGKSLRIDNLRKRKVRVLDWCFMCKCNSEIVDHLFLNCPVAMDLWAMSSGFI